MTAHKLCTLFLGVIGVHCTHGVNRTGYMVCRYMISKLGFAPDQAIAGGSLPSPSIPHLQTDSAFVQSGVTHHRSSVLRDETFAH